MDNAYFEGQVRNYLQERDDDFLIERLKKVQGVSDSIISSEAWDVVLKDAEAWKQQMDDRWQDCFDEKILNQMRIVKQAYNFITQLPQRYKQESEFLQEELKAREDYKNTVEDI